MPDRYTKTDVGRAEIRARVHALTRTARNLLLAQPLRGEGPLRVVEARGRQR